MSIEAINDFFKLLQENELLSREFDNIQAGDDYKEQVVNLAKRYHCEFTQEELECVMQAANKMREQQEQA